VDGAINTISFPLVDVEFLKASTVDVKDISGNDAVIFILLLMFRTYSHFHNLSLENNIT
jgi:hypothetical protein